MTGIVPYERVSEVHIEITNMCNLACEYCYAETILPGRDFKDRLFSIELFRKTVIRLFSESRCQHINLVFHGGEPLLHSAEWFEETCNFAVDYANSVGKTVEFSLQSNLILLKDAHVDVFRRFNVQVGVSLDGDKATHDRIRGRFDRTVLNLDKLRSEGLLSGVIVVIGRHNYNKLPEIFDLLDQLYVSRFHMNISSSVGRGADLEPVGPERTWEAWKTCVDEMIERKGRIIDSRLTSKIRQFLEPPDDIRSTFTQLRCDNVFCHAGVTMVAVQADGRVYPCGCAGSSGTMKTFAYDNINNDKGITSSDYEMMLRRFHAKTEKYENECQTCDARFVCEHGCPAFDHTDPITPENTCKATKKLYAYFTKLDHGVLAHTYTLSSGWIQKSRAETIG